MAGILELPTGTVVSTELYYEQFEKPGLMPFFVPWITFSYLFIPLSSSLSWLIRIFKESWLELNVRKQFEAKSG